MKEITAPVTGTVTFQRVKTTAQQHTFITDGQTFDFRGADSEQRTTDTWVGPVLDSVGEVDLGVQTGECCAPNPSARSPRKPLVLPAPPFAKAVPR